jgi:hypothetical protein
VDINGLGYLGENTYKIIGVALMACLLRVIVSKRFSPVSILRRAVVCVLVGLWSAELLGYLGVSGDLKYVILAFCCFIADDLAVVALDIGKEFRKNPMSLLNFIKKLFGTIGKGH